MARRNIEEIVPELMKVWPQRDGAPAPKKERGQCRAGQAIGNAKALESAVADLLPLLNNGRRNACRSRSRHSNCGRRNHGRRRR